MLSIGCQKRCKILNYLTLTVVYTMLLLNISPYKKSSSAKIKNEYLKTDGDRTHCFFLNIKYNKYVIWNCLKFSLFKFHLSEWKNLPKRSAPVERSNLYLKYYFWTLTTSETQEVQCIIFVRIAVKYFFFLKKHKNLIKIELIFLAKFRNR